MQTQGAMEIALVSMLALSTLSSAQLFYHQSAPSQQSLLGFGFGHHQGVQQAAAAAPSPSRAATDYAHPSVVRNAEREAQLPPELQKSARFYSNPAIAAALAKESWPTAKEAIVVDREAEKIPREMVYKIFKNAGWVRRR